MGILQLPAFALRNEIAGKGLIRVLENEPMETTSIHVLHAFGRQVPMLLWLISAKRQVTHLVDPKQPRPHHRSFDVLLQTILSVGRRQLQHQVRCRDETRLGPPRSPGKPTLSYDVALNFLQVLSAPHIESSSARRMFAVTVELPILSHDSWRSAFSLPVNTPLKATLPSAYAMQFC